MMWDKTGKSLFMTTGDGHVEVYNYDMENNGANIPLPRVRQIQAHARDVFCIDFDPTGKYFAVGSEDALVSLWSLPEYVPVRGISRCEEPIKSVSFSCDGQFLACSSKEIIDITHLETGEQAHMIDTKTEKDKDPENQVEIKPVNSLTWHPSELLLAYAKDSCISIFGYKE
jgi:THO complex subunit 3